MRINRKGNNNRKKLRNEYRCKNKNKNISSGEVSIEGFTAQLYFIFEV